MIEDHDPGDEDRKPVLPLKADGSPVSILDVMLIAHHVKAPGRLVSLVLEENR